MSFYFYLLLTVLFWGAAPIFDKIVLRSLSPVLATMMRSILLATMFTGFVFASGQTKGLLALNWRLLGLIAIAGLLGGGLGQVAYYIALKSERAALVVPLAAAYPVVTMLLGVSLLGEALSLIRAVGVLLVVAGVVLVRLG